MDNGEPVLSSICTVLVELSDVNENLSPPLFDDIAHEATVYGKICIYMFEYNVLKIFIDLEKFRNYY